MIQYKRFVLIIGSMLFLAGCWDNAEVEEKGFVTGIAVDLANSETDSPSPMPTEQYKQKSQSGNSSQGQGQNQDHEQNQNQGQNQDHEQNQNQGQYQGHEQNQNQGQNQSHEQNQNQGQNQSHEQNQNQMQNQSYEKSKSTNDSSDKETSLQRDERILNHNKDEDKELNDNQFQLTQQLINPSSLGSVQNRDTNTQTTAFRNLSQTGDTIIEMNRDMVKQAGRMTNVTHLNVVLFSEAVATKEKLFADLMDIFLREKEMLRSVKIAITKDHAGSYLNILPENEKIPAKYLSKVLENKSNLDIAEPLTVGNVQSFLLSNKSFIIPYINQVNDTTVNYDGLAIYNGMKEKVVGTLTGDEAKGVNLIQTKNQTGTLNFKLDDNDITFEVLNVRSKINLQNKDKDNLKFHITIDVEAGIAEQFGSLNIMEEKNYNKLHHALEKEIKKLAKNTVTILQNDYETDVIGLSTHLYQHEYQMWETIKDDWEKGQLYFPKSKVTIDVNAILEKPGNIIKSN